MGDTRTPSGQQDWRASCSHWRGEAEAQITTIKASRVPPGRQYPQRRYILLSEFGDEWMIGTWKINQWKNRQLLTQ